MHRIALTDFRGVESSEVSFGAPGFTVVVGPNEIGKSSLAEALRLIREFKSSSQHSAIKAVQPTNRDVGPQVQVELSTGAYRLIYTKRWLRKAQTELQILEPRPEQLTGDEAHDRVEQIFADTLDDELWNALQQVQGESLHQARLARVGPLQSALADLADDDAVGGASHEDLLDRIESEFRRYFTATGKPTDTYARSIRELAEREQSVQQAEAAVRAVEDVVERHERLTLQRTVLAERVERARVESAALAEREGALTELRRELDDATARLSQSEVAVASAQGAVDARAERAAEAGERAGLAAAGREALSVATAAYAEVKARLEAFDAEHSDATASVRALHEQVLEGERALRAAMASADASAVRARLASVDSATARLELAEAELADNLVDADIVQQLAEVMARLQADRDAASAGAARVTVERLGEVEVLLDASSVADKATLDVTNTATVEVPGVVRIVVTPDAGAVTRTRLIDERERDVAALLDQLGVADLAEARRRSGERDDAGRRRDAARVERDTLLAGDSIEAVRARLTALSVAPVAAEAASLEETRAAVAALSSQYEAAERVATAALIEREAIATLVRTTSEARIKAETAAASFADEAARASKRLVIDREIHGDDVVAKTLADAEVLGVVHARALETVRVSLRAQDADGLEMLSYNARELAKRLIDDLATHDADLAAASTELEVRGRDGLQGKLDDALSRQADTRRVHGSLESRAGAARLLRETMRTHRDSAQQRYVAPFGQAVEKLGSIVFGPGFRVEIGDDLVIVSRTIDGVTVPFESLSGGAKEQLALIGRLATAQLVSADDGAPVILDDSLGFTDAPRRAKLAAVLNSVGSTAQIIILTCEAGRFADIGSATIVTLG